MGKLQTNDIIVNIMIEFSKTIELFGLTTVEARLFAYLYLSEEDLTLDEMADALGKSKTSISTNIRSLAELNLVTRVWKKGVRKDLYQANSQLFKTFMTSFQRKWIDIARRQKISLEEINNHYKDKSSNELTLEEQTILTERLNEIIIFHAQIETLFKNMKPN
ncbi:GbsR/MarR family transcriptional regulator [Oceanobacillus profundus]|uniref:HTH-type transcriptional regulator n=1 Tax=Oceanobacillus profundus TaxID=372463 RepID=A0A417YEZ8_9BACI|nr:MarR family transcriptional regulator [Oceanobacillus profundus]MBR3118712.1 MarR family transcriptional regulator [Oceanobacillus sp.]RHW31254.1 MarR family transcriptional regulator [Oceanobacillus profundus]